MLRFFRQIRKKLMKQNKVRTYLLYALGEIFLVVIGILIALQLNNWNENRKERETERLILQEIRVNLNIDLDDFHDNISHFNNQAMSSRVLLETIDENGAYHDSLGYYYGYLRIFSHFTVKTSGYRLLQSAGLGMVQNDSLRQAITDLYENQYNYLLTWEKERIDFNITVLENEMKSYHGTRSLSLDIAPELLELPESMQMGARSGIFRNMINFEAFRQDSEFHAVIKDIGETAELMQILHENARNDILEVIDLIDQELE